MIEIFTPASLNEAVPDQVEFVDFGFEEGCFKVTIRETDSGDGEVFELLFEDSLAQRSMDEGNILSGAPNALAPGFDSSGSIVTVSNSEFIEWFHRRSAGIFEDRDLYHVAILTDTETLDILCFTLPVVRRVNSSLARG